MGTTQTIAIAGSEGHARRRWVANAIELNRHTTCMKIRGSVVSLSFIFPHPPENEKKKKKKIQCVHVDFTSNNSFYPTTSVHPESVLILHPMEIQILGQIISGVWTCM